MWQALSVGGAALQGSGDKAPSQQQQWSVRHVHT